MHILITSFTYPFYAEMWRSSKRCFGLVRHKTIEYRFCRTVEPKQGDLQVNYSRCKTTMRREWADNARLDNLIHLSFLFRDVAQLVARVLWEHDAAGSSPVISTTTPDLFDLNASGFKFENFRKKFHQHTGV